MVISAVFFLAVAVRSVVLELRYDLVVCVVISLVVSLRAALEYLNDCPHASVICVLLLAVTGFVQFLYVVLAMIVFVRMGRRFVKESKSADVRLRDAFTAYQRLSAVLKLDLILVLCCIFTGLFYSSGDGSSDGIRANTTGMVLSGVFIVLEIVFEVAAILFAQREDRRGSVFVCVIALVVPIVYLAVVGYEFSAITGLGVDMSPDSPFAKFIMFAAFGTVLVRRRSTRTAPRSTTRPLTCRACVPVRVQCWPTA
jgi:hypothetical protein